ncbi:MAG: 3-phosphoserine/phosphohydroxythreonine transaminase [Nevskiaceae bacterium]|nr:MAG: 3-phosphoserine/phosphohydroxythreonine transaminase [Nevskiaceae bacterium]TBR74782.1 MAG: 3-phosphoserine/phosphohydroxythreonine transaminase [Nevskiaceae bacterium]
MSRVFNFNAGPATLPAEVLEEVRNDLLDWRGCGMSVMEMSHRAEPFATIAHEAEADLRSLLGVSDDYHVLFLQGGATAQFAAIPMNLLGKDAHTDYVVTGGWSAKAADECGKYAHVGIAAQPQGKIYTHIPARDTWTLDEHAAYLYYCANETVHGVEFQYTPEGIKCPLVADFSSCFLSRSVDVNRFGLLYAGAQKNAGIAGLTVVIVRKDLCGHAQPITPRVLDYQVMATAGSMLNTPPTFAWYVSGRVFKWLLNNGGLAAIGARNARKSKQLYDYLDSQDFYTNPIAAADRSRMNVVFTLADKTLDKAFLDGAKAAGMVGLKGHRSVGGMRASLYNALPEGAVATLVSYMQEFVRTRG